MTHLVYKLETITLLDSISLGLIYPFLSTYIQSLGADHVVVGILSVGYLLSGLISTSDIPLPKYGKCFNIIVALFVIMLTHLTLILTCSYWYIVFGRYIFSFVTNQSQHLCKELLLQNSQIDEKQNILTNLSILNGFGYIIGPIIAGYLFDYGFLYIGLLAVLLAFINICLAISICHNGDISMDPAEETVENKTCLNIKEGIQNFLNSDYKRDWDVMTVKFLQTSCVTIFYGKFSQILKHNFESSNITVGYTYAYMNIIIFASTYFTTSLKQQYARFSPILLLENSSTFLCVCLFIACYSPVYPLYLMMCIPIVFFTTFIDSIWKDLFAMRQLDSPGLDERLKNASAMTTPIVFGAICNIIGHHAVIMFSLIPMILSLYIIKRYTKNSVPDKEE